MRELAFGRKRKTARPNNGPTRESARLIKDSMKELGNIRGFSNRSLACERCANSEDIHIYCGGKDFVFDARSSHSGIAIENPYV